MKAGFLSTFLTAVASVGCCIALSLALAEGVEMPDGHAEQMASQQQPVKVAQAAPAGTRQQ